MSRSYLVPDFKPTCVVADESRRLTDSLLWYIRVRGDLFFVTLMIPLLLFYWTKVLFIVVDLFESQILRARKGEASED